MKVTEIKATIDDIVKLSQNNEGQFFDRKSKLIKPSKIAKTLVAMANADGGEVVVGIEDDKRINLFAEQEDANPLVEMVERIFNGHGDVDVDYIIVNEGVAVRFAIIKSQRLYCTPDKEVYKRKGAQDLHITAPEEIVNLQRAKGLISQEDEVVNDYELARIENSSEVIEFMLEVVPTAEPLSWLRKQRLIINERPAVAGVILFDDEPQAVVPKACIKIYRYKTTDQIGSRDSLAGDPITVDGPLYKQIYAAVYETKKIVESIKVESPDGLTSIQYPQESLHEIITNAVLHRDYSVADNIHVRIFDNRIEVDSPGRLPAHITVKNILDERFARNPKVVRMLNKYKNPPNKDVGEGLNTAFDAMRKLRLAAPIIEERENSVLVTIKHEKLASPEQEIIGYIKRKGSINNTEAREATGIQSETKVRKIFAKLVKLREIEPIPGTERATRRYRFPEKKNVV